MDHSNARHHLEKFARQVTRSAAAKRRHAEFAGIGFGVGNELGNRLGRNRGIYLQDKWKLEEARNGRDVADEVVANLFVQACADRVIGTDRAKRITVWWRTHDGLGRDVPACTCAVFNNKRLANSVSQPLTP